MLVEAVLLAQFGSEAEEQGTLILAVLVMVVPAAVDKLTLTTSGKLTEPLTGIFCAMFRVQVMVPVPPTGMVLQVQLAGGVKETRVVPAGMVSVNVATVAAAGPLLVTVCV